MHAKHVTTIAQYFQLWCRDLVSNYKPDIQMRNAEQDRNSLTLAKMVYAKSSTV